MIITAKYLLDGRGGVHPQQGVRIKDNTIVNIDKNEVLRERYPDEEVLEGQNKVLAPGFINTHMHFYGVVSHGLTPPVRIDSFTSFLEDFWWPLVEDKLSVDVITAATRMTALELLNSGVTGVCDILEAPYSLPGVLAEAAEVLEEVGLRALLSIEASQRVAEEQAELALEENINFYQQAQKRELIAGSQCLHTTFTCSRDFISRAFAMAREAGAGIQLHLSESSYEVEKALEKYGLRPVELYNELGVLDDDLLVSQAVKVNEREMDLLQEAGVRVAHLPLSNCEVGGGVAPVPEMLERKIPVGLGTDGYINDFFAVMRGAFLIHKAHHEDPSVMPAETVFKMATSGGAQVAGFNASGEIAAGRKADLIMINIDAPTPVTAENIYDQLILYHGPQQVKEVIINGKFIKRDGKLINYDLEQIKKETNQVVENLWREIK